MVARVRVKSNPTMPISLAAESSRGQTRQVKPVSDKKMHQEHHKGNAFTTCWLFRQKERTATEPMDKFTATGAEDREGRLRELSVRWFMDTQAPLILRNGIFPSWFQGFITRKDAEKILHEKELGSFLIRLSDKATGYILSYKGNGRCRHFMMSQSKTGQFIVAGDTREHPSLTELIEYYKKSPIEPFGEYLTYSCLEECAEELYDMIQVSHHEKPPVNTRARMPVTVAPQSHQKPEEMPPLPRRRRAQVDGCVSDGRGSPCGGEASLARPGKPSSSSSREGGRVLAESTPGRAAWLEPETPRSRPPRPPPPHQLLLAGPPTITSTSEPPRTVYSLLQPLEAKSASLPLLLDAPSEREAPPRLSPPPPRPSPRSSPRSSPRGGGGARGGGHSRPVSSHSLDYLSSSPVYHLATAGQGPVDGKERSAPPNKDYASGLFDDDAYEMLPGADGPPLARGEPRRDSHTYESLEDLRVKPVGPSAGAKDERWKWFPELKWK
ncbi:SH2 domain-containing protein 7-like [Gadus chalcogrammus]|uniref:SH2 domain-containing protein 7-like n=1 Tax=Gadus chalcogrammus TaxID=1042646 RepID=UPI0024C4C2E2|nr:SH2 domain-containing protein 7-like [Gadus chalcogrammus]